MSDYLTSHLSPNGGENHAGDVNDCWACNNPVYIKLQTKAEPKVKLYFDFADWWIGLYAGPNHWYICVLPCVVLRIKRRRASAYASGTVTMPSHFDNWARTFAPTITHVALYDSAGPERPDAPKDLWHIGTSGPLHSCSRTDDHPIKECERR